MSGDGFDGLSFNNLLASGNSSATTDSTLSCSICHAPLQDAKVLPNCLHSFCRSCLEKHAGGSHSFPCPAPSCGNKVESSVEELPANTFSSFLNGLSLDQDGLETDFERLSFSAGAVGPVCPPSSSVHQSAQGLDWRPTNPVQQDIPWSPWRHPESNCFSPLGDQVRVVGREGRKWSQQHEAHVVPNSVQMYLKLKIY